MAYTRTPQGSHGAPLSWTILFGLINRCALSALREPGSAHGQKLQVYVDDPALIVSGPRRHRRQQVALTMLIWHLLGINLAIDKGQIGRVADWIGAIYSVHNAGVFVTILQNRLDEIAALAEKIICRSGHPYQQGENDGESKARAPPCRRV